jgi:uncharacterized protein YdeI (BOF family)
MSLRNLFCGLFALVSLVSAPAFAQNTGITINNDQNTVISGSGNNAQNNSNQSVRDSRGSRNTGDTGVSLNNKQTCDILGDNNSCTNNSTQSVDLRRGRNR